MELINSNNNETALQRSQTGLQSIPKTLSNFPTFSDFSQRFNPSNWEKGSRLPTKCVVCNSPTLTDVNIAYGNGRAVAWLMAQLATFQEKINVPNKMSTYEIETCAQTIYDNYHHLKATELMLFFTRFLGGMYPVDWHGYVTPTKIVSAIREHFMPWRNELLYKIEKQEAEKRREEESKTPGITWEEYCKLKGIEKGNPLTNLKQSV